MTVELPLFPLNRIVLPGGMLPLRVFERRYLDMISECFRSGQGFGICLIDEGQEAGVPARPYMLGTEVRLVDFDQGEDGVLQVVAEGQKEFDVLDYTVDDAGLLHGRVEHFLASSAGESAVGYEHLASKLKMIVSQIDTDVALDHARFDDPDWVCYRLLEVLPLPAPMRIEMLQQRDNVVRLEALGQLQIEIGLR